MSLQAKDLQAICSVMLDLRQAVEASATYPPEVAARTRAQAFDSAVWSLARILQGHNPKFNRARFIAECGAKGR